MIDGKFTTYMEDIEQKVIKKATEKGMAQGIAQGREQGREQGMKQGMKITYFITKNPNLSDEEISIQTGNDIETVQKIRKSLMELI